jgi:hypothetical protein
MSRPNQGHPTFSVLLHTDDIPRRARVSFDDWQDFAVAAVAVLHQLIVFGPVAHAQSKPVLVFALQAQGTSFKLKGADLVFNVTLAAELALLVDQRTAVGWRRGTLFDDRPVFLEEFRGLWWCRRRRRWRWTNLLNDCLAFLGDRLRGTAAAGAVADRAAWRREMTAGRGSNTRRRRTVRSRAVRTVGVMRLDDRRGEVRRWVDVLLSDDFFVSKFLRRSRRLFDLFFVAVDRLFVCRIVSVILCCKKQSPTNLLPCTFH